MLPITLTIPCALCFGCVLWFSFKKKYDYIVCSSKKKKKSYLNNKPPTPNSIPKTRARPSIDIALISHTPFYADSVNDKRSFRN